MAIAFHSIISQLVAARLGKPGVPHEVEGTASDVGVQLTLSKGRRETTLMARLNYADKRLRDTSRLLRLNRAARRLTRTWGIAAGLLG